MLKFNDTWHLFVLVIVFGLLIIFGVTLFVWSIIPDTTVEQKAEQKKTTERYNALYRGEWIEISSLPNGERCWQKGHQTNIGGNIVSVITMCENSSER